MNKLVKTPQAGEGETNKVVSVKPGSDNQTVEFAAKVLLARCFGGPEVLFKVTSEVTPEMILNPHLQFIYKAIKNLADKGGKVNITSVRHEMMSMDGKRYEEMGGIGEDILNINDMVPTFDDDSESYIEVLKRAYGRRQLNEICQAARGKEDFDEALNCIDEGVFQLRKGSAQMKEAKSVYECGLELLAGFKQSQEAGVDNMRVLTHIEGLDNTLGGLYNGEVTVLAGNPGDGKSAVALNIAVNAAMEGKKVGYFNLEMSNKQTILRIIARLGDVDAQKLRVWGPTEEDTVKIERAVETLKELPLYLYDIEQSSKVSKIHAAVKIRKRETGCDLVVIDHLHQFNEGGSRGVNETDRIGGIIRAIKNMAVTEDVPVLLLSQLNRNVKLHTATDKNDKGETITVTLPPTLPDLRGSGDIEAVADNAIFIYHPKKNNMLRDENGRPFDDCDGLFYIRKARNSATGRVRFIRAKNFSWVRDYEEYNREKLSEAEQSKRGGENG